MAEGLTHPAESRDLRLAHSQPKRTFQTLPAELRLEIYSFVFLACCPSAIVEPCCSPPRYLDILQVCRQIHDEAEKVLYECVARRFKSPRCEREALLVLNPYETNDGIDNAIIERLKGLGAKIGWLKKIELVWTHTSRTRHLYGDPWTSEDLEGQERKGYVRDYGQNICDVLQFLKLHATGLRELTLIIPTTLKAVLVLPWTEFDGPHLIEAGKFHTTATGFGGEVYGERLGIVNDLVQIKGLKSLTVGPICNAFKSAENLGRLMGVRRVYIVSGRPRCSICVGWREELTDGNLATCQSKTSPKENGWKDVEAWEGSLRMALDL